MKSRLSASGIRRFARDESGSMSAMGAVLIALLLGLGTASIKAGEGYAQQLRAFRTADLAARTASKSSVTNATQAIAVTDHAAATNGAKTGTATVDNRQGKTCFTFPCGLVSCL